MLRFAKHYSSYKSAIALDTLYPNSTLQLTTPNFMNDAEKFNGYIPINELDITYSKSSGPGGQNVNKVNTKVDVRFQLESATWLNSKIKEVLKSKLKTKMTNDGFLVFRSDITRSQQLNLADCLDKIRRCIYSSMVLDPVSNEETVEHHRRRYEKSIRERLLRKRQRSQLKEDRRDPLVA
ncbi:hypothetical protein RI129_009239 [Pyrocoelia pectoralis]|uniref:Large ribosomal subunit protein mL62 n=1 Tax=Pyrocoelia pectoralis TaxID=417401 RepID=A0AAN7V468_9COLE